ncbi:ATP-binding protein [Agrobacterium vitis]|nr:ATP-binding protein [Agrobacterium vitis]
MSFERSRLYSAAFLQIRKDEDSDEQDFFKGHFLAMRARVKPLVARVLRDMPGYTIHDITHLDALWETASLVVSDDFSLNPVEAFVFGAAILLHDASMTIAAYPNGVSELKNSLEWRDYVALFKERNGSAPDDALVLTNVLRILHARHAENLAIQHWPGADGKADEFLIEDNEIRRYYGPTIGLIAHSHWWPINQVQSKLSSHLSPLPPHTKCSVDKLKLAGLLRVADAIHLDRRRAPPFVRAIDRPKGYSDLHWAFQGRLGFPRVEGDTLQFSAGEACPIEESESWWLGYDALTLADRELRETDLLLRDSGRPGLKVQRVKGVQDPAELAHFIPVSGWKPVNSRFHISDVPRIISIFGGSKLYGSEWYAPLRELLQNANDAIQARRILQSTDKVGQIDVILENREDGFWLVVEDDGVGMSETVLTNQLVDFGSSLWRTTAVNEEFPGLAASGMESVGRFGVGFFSVFMISKEVRVITRRYDHASSNALKLLFNNGFESRPVLAPAENSEAPKNGGTRVELKLFDDPYDDGKFVFALHDRSISEKISIFANFNKIVPSNIGELVKKIAPCSQNIIQVTENGKPERVIEANDWINCDPVALCERISDPTRILTQWIPKLMRPIKNESGEIVGRAAIWPSEASWSQNGILMSGGFKIQNIPHFAGVLLGQVQTAARSSGTATLDDVVMSEWATEQADLITKTDIPDEQRALMAEIILNLKGKISGLPIAFQNGVWYNEKQLRKVLRNLDKVNIHLGYINHDDDDDVSSSAFEREFEINNELFIIPTLRGGFSIQSNGRFSPIKSLLEDLFDSILRSVWKKGRKTTAEEIVVGTVKYSDIERFTTLYTKI